MFVKLACIPNFSFLGTCSIFVRGGCVGLTVIIRQVSVPNWTGTELANLNFRKEFLWVCQKVYKLTNSLSKTSHRLKHIGSYSVNILYCMASVVLTSISPYWWSIRIIFPSWPSTDSTTLFSRQFSEYLMN